MSTGPLGNLTSPGQLPHDAPVEGPRQHLPRDALEAAAGAACPGAEQVQLPHMWQRGPYRGRSCRRRGRAPSVAAQLSPVSEAFASGGAVAQGVWCVFRDESETGCCCGCVVKPGPQAEWRLRGAGSCRLGDQPPGSSNALLLLLLPLRSLLPLLQGLLLVVEQLSAGLLQQLAVAAGACDCRWRSRVAPPQRHSEAEGWGGDVGRP